MANKTYFTERKEFIKRMIEEGFHKNLSWSKEQMVAKEIFNKYPLDFLSVVAPPFKMNSIMWFKTKKGKEYLAKKFKEYNYKPIKEDKIIEFTEKAGDDIDVKKQLTFRDFMRE